jgi:inward rectifier potassium channel
MPTFAPRIKNQQSELGLGKHVTTKGRLVNQDGSFNVVRHHSGFWDNLYHVLVTMPPWKFFLLVFIIFGCINGLFASLYVLGGADVLSNMPTNSYTEAWMHAFFFSSQTITTVGYGHISPNGYYASLLASLESFLGLLFFALISGLLYGRFSRPIANIWFSPNALVSPYQGGTGLMFRIVNPRKSELLEAMVEVTLAINQRDEETGEVARRFFPLNLEIPRIAFFNLAWTLVHPIAEGSPVFGLSETEFLEANAEILVLFKGMDESTEQLVHARYSYISTEVVWNAKFAPMMSRSEDQTKMVVHSRKVGDFVHL